MTASLSFVPATPLKFPTFRGLFVQRTVQLLGADSLNGEGPSLAVMPVGSIVVISVQVTTPDRLGPTTIRVLLPAGLEPIDLSTNSLGGVCPIPFFEAFGPRISFSCPTQVRSAIVYILQCIEWCLFACESTENPFFTCFDFLRLLGFCHHKHS